MTPSGPPETRTIGRYVVGRALSVGLGDPLWLAYDPLLDRPVTLRLLDDDNASRLATLRAAARLDHASVVPVFDVGRVPEGVFVTSGHIDGRSLGHWRRERRRGWRDVLGVFLRAGEALAAAHAAGLAHGSFTTSRLIIGWNGGVYLDGFGDAPGATTDGDLRAFAASLRDALEDCESEDVPAFVKQALREALGEPSARRPRDLRALLQRLARDPSVTRRRRRLVGASIASLLATAVATVLAARTPPPCAAAAERLVGVWDDTNRTRIRDAFTRARRAEAHHAWRVTEARLDAYARAWLAGHKDACEATHVRGEQSSTALDLRMRCLDDRREELSALASVLADADVAVVRKAAQAAASMQPVERCADVASLAAGPRVPADPAARARGQALAGALAHARALQRAGRYADAVQRARDVATQARADGHGSILAGATTLVGLLEMRARRTRAAEDALTDAAFTALSVAHDRALAEASVALVSLEYQDKRRLGRSRWWAARARAAIDRGGRQPDLESQLQRRLGDVAVQRGRYAEALSHFQRALEAMPEDNLPARATSEDRLGRIHRMLGRDSEALAHHQRALALFEAALGPHHPNVAIALHAVALALRGVGRLREAVEYHTRALELQRATLGPGHVDLAGMENALGITLWHLGDAAGAHARFSAALPAYERRFGSAHVAVASLHNNLARTLLRLDRKDEARAAASRAVELSKELHGADHPETAGVLLVWAECEQSRDANRALEGARRAITLARAIRSGGSKDLAAALRVEGRILLALGRPADARRSLGAAVDLLAKAKRPLLAALYDFARALGALGETAAAEAALTRAVAIAKTTEGNPRDSGRAYLALARLLWRRAADHPRALALVDAARTAFTSARPPDRAGLAEVEVWPAH